MSNKQQEELIDVVQIDGQVVLKIINHARDNAPSEATGLLLGLPIDGRLEVTNCIPQSKGDDEGANDETQTALMASLRQVNVDDNTVGWFLATSISTFFSKLTIDAQYEYQSAIPNSICILLDPYRRHSGKLGLRAFRLTEHFMQVYAKNDFSQNGFSQYGVESGDIMEEVRIQVHNSHLDHAFLYELRESKAMSTNSTLLGVHLNGPEQQLESLSLAIDEYTQEQGKYHYYERSMARNKSQQQQWLAKRQSENEARAKQGKPALPDDRAKFSFFKPLPKPSRIESMLIVNQLHQTSNAILENCTQGFSKMYVVDALRR